MEDLATGDRHRGPGLARAASGAIADVIGDGVPTTTRGRRLELRSDPPAPIIQNSAADRVGARCAGVSATTSPRLRQARLLRTKALASGATRPAGLLPPFTLAAFRQFPGGVLPKSSAARGLAWERPGTVLAAAHRPAAIRPRRWWRPTAGGGEKWPDRPLDLRREARRQAARDVGKRKARPPPSRPP
jgi:hypothetical protein